MSYDTVFKKIVFRLDDHGELVGYGYVYNANGEIDRDRSCMIPLHRPCILTEDLIYDLDDFLSENDKEITEEDLNSFPFLPVEPSDEQWETAMRLFEGGIVARDRRILLKHFTTLTEAGTTDDEIYERFGRSRETRGALDASTW